jgi:hypothetical protein
MKIPCCRMADRGELKRASIYVCLLAALTHAAETGGTEGEGTQSEPDMSRFGNYSDRYGAIGGIVIPCLVDGGRRAQAGKGHFRPAIMGITILGEFESKIAGIADRPTAVTERIVYVYTIAAVCGCHYTGKTIRIEAKGIRSGAKLGSCR